MTIVAATDCRTAVSTTADASDGLEGRDTRPTASRGERATDSASEPSNDCMLGPASPMDAQARAGGMNATQSGHGA